jgi:hypothetical protein
VRKILTTVILKCIKMLQLISFCFLFYLYKLVISSKQAETCGCIPDVIMQCKMCVVVFDVCLLQHNKLNHVKINDGGVRIEVWRGNIRIEHGKCHKRLKKITSDKQCILCTARNIVMTMDGKFTGQAMYAITGCGKLILKTRNK